MVNNKLVVTITSHHLHLLYKVSPRFLLPVPPWNGSQPSHCFSEYQAKLCDTTIGDEELVSLTVLRS